MGLLLHASLTDQRWLPKCNVWTQLRSCLGSAQKGAHTDECCGHPERGTRHERVQRKESDAVHVCVREWEFSSLEMSAFSDVISEFTWTTSSQIAQHFQNAGSP